MGNSDVRWRVEIWQESSGGYSVQDLDFPAESPLTIEWSGTAKTDPVASSSATLKLYSMTDRKYIDLYTTEAGSIRMDVYRIGSLYWSGTLDTEIYREPYAYRDGYEVTLTFADFAILDRQKFASASSFLSLSDVVALCLTSSQINYSGLSTAISTVTSGGATILTNVYVMRDNFFDEDGVAMTLREVLNSVLQPFGLRIIQKGGQIKLYDIHGLVTSAGDGWSAAVVWDSIDSELSVDETFNNVKVTYSPYMKNKLFDIELEPDEIGEGATYRFMTGTDSDDIDGFDIRLSESTTSGQLAKGPSAKYFAVTPIYSGSAEAGLAAVVRTTADGGEVYTDRALYATGTPSDGTLLMVTSEPAFIYLTGSDSYKLKLTVEALVDARYNPYEEAAQNNEEGDDGRFQERSGQGYLFVKVQLKNNAGTVINHYSNEEVYNKVQTPLLSWLQASPWPSGTAAWTDARMAYYADNPNDRYDSSGWNGWTKNKPIISQYQTNMKYPKPTVLKYLTEGEYMPLPPSSGWIEIQINGAVQLYSVNPGKVFDYAQLKWFLLKSLTLELVDGYGNEIDEQDYITQAWITDTAREDLEIDTIIGTLPEGAHPTARGQLFDSTLQVIENFTRAEVTDKLERLLCGTIYSQYAGRKAKLGGTARLLTGFQSMTDVHTPGQFLVVKEVQDCIAETSEIEMVQIVADNYTGVPYVN
jgi:hypothetical protein